VLANIVSAAESPLTQDLRVTDRRCNRWQTKKTCGSPRRNGKSRERGRWRSWGRDERRPPSPRPLACLYNRIYVARITSQMKESKSPQPKSQWVWLDWQGAMQLRRPDLNNVRTIGPWPNLPPPTA
jgi:hypothetical protein